MKFRDLKYRAQFTVADDWNTKYMKDSPVTATDANCSRMFQDETEVELEKNPKETDYIP